MEESEQRPLDEQRPLRVLVADDHPLMREALCGWLERRDGVTVCAEAAHGLEVLDLCRTHQPDLAVVDLDMPGMDGVEVTQMLTKSCPTTRALIYTGMDSTFEALRAYRAGAFAFVVKTSTMRAFEEALRQVAVGRKHFPEAMRDELAGDLVARSGPGEPIDDLTDREHEVFALVAKGKTTREIAEQLDVTTRTVTRHKSRVFEKLGASTDADLARFAMRMRIIDA